MTLVERDEELHVLASAYQACANGNGQLVIVSGGVACGKTTLLRTFTAAVVQQGAVMLSAIGSRSERSIRFGVLMQLVSGTTLPGLPAEPGSTGASEPLRSSEARVLDEVCAAVTELACKQPVVIAVDDVQFADDPSRQALLYVQRRMRHARVLLVLTEWLSPDLAYDGFRAEVTRQLPTTHLRLAPLSPKGVAAKLADDLGHRPSVPRSHAYHAVTGGNPLLVAALAEDSQVGGATEGLHAGTAEEPVAIGPEFRRAVVTFLHRCEPVVREMIRGLAALGDLGTRHRLGQLLDIGSRSVVRALDSVEAASLLDDDRFRHPMIRTAVLDSIDPCDRARLHLRTAELLYVNGYGKASEVAEHLAAADHLGAPVSGSWVVAVLRYAAEEHLEADHLDLAAQRLDLAVRISRDETEQASVARLLMGVEWRRKPAAVAPWVSALSGMLGTDAEMDGEAALDLAKFLLWYGNTSALADLLAGVAAAAPPDQHRTAMALRWLAFLCPQASPQLPPVTAPAAGAVHTCSWRATQMLDQVKAGGPRAEIWAAAEELLQCCPLTEDSLEVQMSAVAALLVTDRTDRAAHWCERLHAAAEARQVLTWRAVIGALRAELLFRRGEVARAERMARAAFELSSPLGWGVAIGLPLSVRVAALTQHGRHDLASSILRLPVPESMFETQFGLLYLHRRGMHHLATGRGRAASADFEQCAELITRWGIEHSALVPLPAVRAEATTSSASRPVPDRRGLRVVGGTRAPGIPGRAAVQDGNLAVASRPAPEPALRVPVPLGGEQPSTLVVSALSQAELRVATLAAGGYTNRQIGNKLYITVSTVEQHLTRVYRKLKVRRRDELPAELLQSYDVL